MAISTDYAAPVTVNGFSCRNCTDVAYAQKHVDPAHPKSGPFDVNAASDPTRAKAERKLSPIRPLASEVAARPPTYAAGGKVALSPAVGALVDISG